MKMLHQQEEEDKEGLRQLTLSHVWVPLRPWNVLTGPDGFEIFVEGKGCRLIDINGREYIDCDSGVGNVCNLGYGRHEIAEAAYEQMKRLHFQPTHDLTIPQIKLAKKLSDITPGNLSKVFFSNSGTEAIEAGIKIARQFQKLSGFANRHKIIVGGYRYHGCTYGSMSLGWRRPSLSWDDFEPLVPGTLHVVSPYCFRCDLGLQYPDCNLQCVKQIEWVIENEGPETVAAFLDVTIASEYATSPPAEYWPMVRSICDKYGILLILDEVMMAFGRTGRMFACEHWNVVPDIMAVAKSLTNGYIPLGAAVVTEKVAQKFEGGYREALKHSYTFLGHATACAAGLATIELMEKENIVKNSRIMGEYLLKGLQSLCSHRIVAEIRGGVGLNCLIEFRRDKDTKFSLDEEKKVIAMLKKGLRKAGLWCPVSTSLRLCPPLIITKEEVDEILNRLDKVVGEVEGAL